MELSEPEIAAFMRHCLDAVNFLHSLGRIHRDIKARATEADPIFRKTSCFIRKTSYVIRITLCVNSYDVVCYSYDIYNVAALYFIRAALRNSRGAGARNLPLSGMEL
jgi:serine/threonine protein kinase